MDTTTPAATPPDPQGGLTVSDVMSTEVRTVGTTEFVGPVRDMLLGTGIHAVPVVDQAGKLVGIVSSLDLLAVLAGETERLSQPDVRPAGVAAQVGDVVVIRGHAVGLRERRGRITEVRGPDGTPPYLVQWLDDPHDEPHEVLFFPGPDADLEHHRMAQ